MRAGAGAAVAFSAAGAVGVRTVLLGATKAVRQFSAANGVEAGPATALGTAASAASTMRDAPNAMPTKTAQTTAKTATNDRAPTYVTPLSRSKSSRIHAISVKPHLPTCRSLA